MCKFLQYFIFQSKDKVWRCQSKISGSSAWQPLLNLHLEKVKDTKRQSKWKYDNNLRATTIRFFLSFPSQKQDFFELWMHITFNFTFCNGWHQNEPHAIGYLGAYLLLHIELLMIYLPYKGFYKVKRICLKFKLIRFFLFQYYSKWKRVYSNWSDFLYVAILLKK